VADGHPVAYDHRVEVPLAVEDGAILYVAALAYPDGVDVAAEDGVHPNRGSFAQHNVSDKLGADINIATCGYLGYVAQVATDHGAVASCFESEC
jgi:hypothetical protein